MEALPSSGVYKPTVVLNGAAKDGRPGSTDPVEIYIREALFLFRVRLPNMENDGGDLKLDLHSDGKVYIQGTMSGGEISIGQSPIICNKRVRLFSPLGHFSISFSLPGPVEPRYFIYVITDSSIQCIVLRSGLPEARRVALIHLFESP